jgi:hypothetical protein
VPTSIYKAGKQIFKKTKVNISPTSVLVWFKVGKCYGKSGELACEIVFKNLFMLSIRAWAGAVGD